MQLDIFEHSRDVMLRNDALQALQQRDAGAARAACQALAAEYPQDAHLQPLQVLCAALEPADSSPFRGHAVAQAQLHDLHEAIEPAAQRVFGARDGATWLAPVWRQCAQRAAGLAFRAECAPVHAAPLYLRAGDAAAAAVAVAAIPSWHRIPAPLAWMTDARFRIDGLDAAWGLLAELAWLSPSRFDELTQRLADPVLKRLRKQFDGAFEGDGTVAELAWLPAWILTEKPALAALLGSARDGLQSAPERAMRLLLDLLHLESQGRQRELVVQRKKLRDLHPALYAAYMRSR